MDCSLTIREPSEEPSEEKEEAREVDLFAAEEPSQPEPVDLFEDFWKAYPKKAGKPAARKAWAKAIRKAPPEIIIERARRYAAWLADADAKTFRPHPKHPQGWLNDERWNDAELREQPSDEDNEFRAILREVGAR